MIAINDSHVQRNQLTAEAGSLCRVTRGGAGSLPSMECAAYPLVLPDVCGLARTSTVATRMLRSSFWDRDQCWMAWVVHLYRDVCVSQGLGLVLVAGVRG